MYTTSSLFEARKKKFWETWETWEFLTFVSLCLAFFGLAGKHAGDGQAPITELGFFSDLVSAHNFPIVLDIFSNIFFILGVFELVNWFNIYKENRTQKMSFLSSLINVKCGGPFFALAGCCLVLAHTFAKEGFEAFFGFVAAGIAPAFFITAFAFNIYNFYQKLKAINFSANPNEYWMLWTKLLVNILGLLSVAAGLLFATLPPVFLLIGALATLVLVCVVGYKLLFGSTPSLPEKQVAAEDCEAPSLPQNKFSDATILTPLAPSSSTALSSGSVSSSVALPSAEPQKHKDFELAILEGGYAKTPTLQYKRDPKQVLIMGDLDGNGVKLATFLVAHGVLEFKQQEDYAELRSIHSKSNLTKKDLTRFDAILNNATYHPEAAKEIIFVGDDLCDRGEVETKSVDTFFGPQISEASKGGNDYLMLTFFRVLKEKKIPFKVLFSNHGAEAVRAFLRDPDLKDLEKIALQERIEYLKQKHEYELSDDEKKLMEGDKHAFRSDVLDDRHSYTMLQLRELMARRVVEKSKIKALFQGYLKHVDALTYCVAPDGKSITIVSHAPIGFEVIEGLAKRFEVKYDQSSAAALANTIDSINEKFKAAINSADSKAEKKGEGLCNREALSNGYNKKCFSDTFSLEALIWNRNYLSVNRDFVVKNIHNEPYNVYFVHGHDDDEYHLERRNNCYNLMDRDRGKTCVFSVSSQLPASEWQEVQKRSEVKVETLSQVVTVSVTLQPTSPASSSAVMPRVDSASVSGNCMALFAPPPPSDPALVSAAASPPTV